MRRPVAVICSDVHYNLQTLPLADAAMRMAVSKANELGVPLIVAGDLHDTKANLRGECMNAMIKTFNLLDRHLDCFILRGNHDAINEKSVEHSLSFLYTPFIADSDCESDGCAGHKIVDTPLFTNLVCVNNKSVHLIPYQHNPHDLRTYLKKVDEGSCIIMHQGLQGTNSGDYMHDKSAISHEDVKDFRVISGHYHTRQTIKTRMLPRCIGGSFKAIQREHFLHDIGVGLFDYIGNPYTLTYGEANDPPKGFQILMDDGTLEFVPTNLRKHVVWNEVIGQHIDQPSVNEGDLLWIKIHGTREQLANITRSSIPLSMPFKLDLIPTNTTSVHDSQTATLKSGELLDSLIDGLTATSDERKTRLKQLWKQLCE
jgi:UDP-2,3-diacylglucosamine pyrophosphatase LpxH